MKVKDVKRKVADTALQRGWPYVRVNYTAICREAGIMRGEMAAIFAGRGRMAEAKRRLASWVGVPVEELFREDGGDPKTQSKRDRYREDFERFVTESTSARADTAAPEPGGPQPTSPPAARADEMKVET